MLDVFVLLLGTQRTPERCSTEHVVSGGLHLADWCRVWPVTAPQKREPLVTHVNTYWKCPTQHNEGGTQCCCHDSTQHPPLTHVTDCQIVWDRSEKQLNHNTVVTWSLHERRMNDCVCFVSDGRWELRHCSQRAWRLMSYQSHTWQRTPILDHHFTSPLKLNMQSYIAGLLGTPSSS